ncbi:MAG: DMT family transporter [Clostridia bacterium]|nr:DMT family transporter [Clostridia bacterium]
MREKRLTGDAARRGGKLAAAYAGIIFVVFIWGIYPVLAAGLLEHYSGGAFSLTGALISASVLTLLSVPKLGQIDRRYFAAALPTGFFVAAANLLQKIGLRFTTPARYAFLENLSCVAVPFLLFLLIRKKPRIPTLAAAFLCLCGCFVLSGPVISSGGAPGVGEILCAAAGLLYGVNIAATGVYAKKLDAMLYVMLQTWVSVAVSGAGAFALDRISAGGEPVERFVISADPGQILLLAALALAVSTLGWIIRTEAMKYVNPSAVAVIMPFSSVVTGVAAVIVGRDVFSANLLLGGLIILISSIVSGVGDARDNRDASGETERKEQ